MSNIVSLEVNGVLYRGITDITINQSLENFAKSFSGSIVSKELILENTRIVENPIKVQDEAVIYIDNNKILTGYIEEVNISYDASSHIINFSGRDKVGLLIDSSIISTNYNKQFSLVNLIRQALNDNGYTNIEVIEQVANIGLFEDNETVSAEEEPIFSFFDRYARKVQALLTTNEEGNIVITRESTDQAIGSLYSERGGRKNNIKSANLTNSILNRFNNIEIIGQSGNDTFGANTVNQIGSATDSQITLNRKLRVVTSVTSKEPILNDAARWEVNVRRARGSVYSCVLAQFGFYQDKELTTLWKPNQLVNIKDDKCNLDGTYLIMGVTFNKSNDGTTTTLNITSQGAFSNNPLDEVPDKTTDLTAALEDQQIEN